MASNEKFLPAKKENIKSNKKLYVFYILEILKTYSDENHILSQFDIMQYLLNEFNVDCDRKTVSTNINVLEEMGYDLVRVKKHGIYLSQREFEPSQISYLIDAVFSSRSITSSQAREVSFKLYSFLSKYKRKKYDYIFKSDKVSRSGNTQVFLNIEMIQDAIDQGKKISFDYVRSAIVNTHSQKVVSPFFLTNSRGTYYLTCFQKNESGLSNFKVDKIQNITILPEDAVSITKVKGYENGIDKSKYINENFYMFSGKTVKATLLIDNDYAIADIEDWFDDTTVFKNKAGKKYAIVTANEQSLIYWCLQYGKYISLVKPESTRNKIKEEIEKIRQKYE